MAQMKMKENWFLNFMALFLYFGYKCCAITLEQPSVLGAAVGSTVNLSCHLHLGKSIVDRVNLYWLLRDANHTIQQYLVPANSEASIVSTNSIWISNPNHSTDMSLTVAKVRLSYTGLYVCHLSLLVNSQSLGATGNGTYLVVHEQLEIIANGSDIICRTKVHNVEDVTLVWKSDVGTLENSIYQRLPDLNNASWISNLLPNASANCRGWNIVATCQLQYKGKTLAEEHKEIYCPELQVPQPVHLYSLILGSSVLILFVLLIIWLTKRRNHRKNVEYAQYMNTSNFKKFRKI